MNKNVNINYLYKNFIKILILIILLFTAFYLSWIGGYGSDEDTLPMIGVFINYFKGNFMTSRFTGYPVAEFGIGFLSYYFGSFAANITTFLLCLFGLILFYLSFAKKNNFLIYLILVFSNPFIFFDNLEPIDYSWAFFFFSSALFFLTKKRFDLACVFFGLCIGARINFLPFVFVAIYLTKFNYKFEFFSRSIMFACSFFIGGIFYLTVWIQSGLTLDWLTAARPYEQGIFGYFSRFTYKLIMAFGLIQFFLIFYFFIKYKNFIIKYHSFNFLFSIIILNLIIFFYIPAEISYLQPMIIATYFLISQTFSKKIIYVIIFLNFFSWVINYDYIKIYYESNDICDRTLALDADFKFSLQDGYYKKYIDSRKKIICWVDEDSEYGKKVINGSRLRD
jgi:hypothetical protein